jgi:flagellar biosynthesis regulator FlaF
MSIRAEDQQHATHLRASLLAIGLIWNKDYRLVKRKSKWRADFMRAVTDEQVHRTNQLVDTIMNS